MVVHTFNTSRQRKVPDWQMSSRTARAIGTQSPGTRITSIHTTPSFFHGASGGGLRSTRTLPTETTWNHLKIKKKKRTNKRKKTRHSEETWLSCTLETKVAECKPWWSYSILRSTRVALRDRTALITAWLYDHLLTCSEIPLFWACLSSLLYCWPLLGQGHKEQPTFFMFTNIAQKTLKILRVPKSP